MNKLEACLSWILVVCMVSMLVGAYVDGTAFDRSPVYPMIVFPIVLIIVIVLMIRLVFSLAASALTRRRPTVRVASLVAMALFVGSYFLPFSTFVAGLHSAVHDNLRRDRLIEFAERVKAAGAQDLHWGAPSWQQKVVAMLRKDFPAELGLSELRPRVGVGSGVVNVYYGGALPGHWGYAVVDNDACPVDYLPTKLCRKAFDNVWVYYEP
jgi:hypothetical protein